MKNLFQGFSRIKHLTLPLCVFLVMAAARTCEAFHPELFDYDVYLNGSRCGDGTGTAGAELTDAFLQADLGCSGLSKSDVSYLTLTYCGDRGNGTENVFSVSGTWDEIATGNYFTSCEKGDVHTASSAAMPTAADLLYIIDFHTDPYVKDVVAGTSGITFAANVTETTDTWAVESMDDILPLAHSVNAWGATSAAPKATITYTFNGGEPQTLGSYSDDDPPAEWPVRNGTYVFTHQPGNLTMTVTVNMPIVKLLSVQQRYPWNGIVDYTYMLDGLSGDKTYKLAVEMTVDGETKATTNDLTTIATGDYSGTLNAAELFPDKYGTKGKLKLSVLKENK